MDGAAQPIIPFTSQPGLSPPQVLYKVDGFKNVQSHLPGYPSPSYWSISWPCPACPAPNMSCLFSSFGPMMQRRNEGITQNHCYQLSAATLDLSHLKEKGTK